MIETFNPQTSLLLRGMKNMKILRLQKMAGSDHVLLKRTKRHIGGTLIILAAIAISMQPVFGGVKTKIDDTKWFDIGVRVQTWYQAVGVNEGPDLNDFQIRRFYLYTEGQVVKDVTFFAHIGGDRLGQDGLFSPNTGAGVGNGFALRDGWIAYSPANEFKIQMGRMYIPFNRASGTVSTFALLTLDLPLAQGGVRPVTGAPYYPSTAGRDEGVTVWGNLGKGFLQYRVGIFDGQNSQKRPRTAARISINPLEKETTWFNRGNYLGAGKVLSIGAGFDRQPGLAGSNTSDYSAWTTDVFFDHPVKTGAVTLEWAYTGIRNSATLGDAKTWYLQGGVLLPPLSSQVRIQPYVKYESIYRRTASDFDYAGGGVNILFNGHNLKLTLEYDKVLNEVDTYGSMDHHFTAGLQVLF
ncbi:MAG TPA: porin [Acidobacteriota bacterium]|nr:porin [Acidobacteriota bacterium]